MNQPMPNSEKRKNVVVSALPDPKPEEKPHEPPPPVDNEHVADGADKFDGETIGFNKALAKVQTFFDELMAERNKPHCGDQWKAMVDGLCKRAQERSLWKPAPQTNG